jgi:hypothetical protein
MSEFLNTYLCRDVELNVNIKFNTRSGSGASLPESANGGQLTGVCFIAF